jgi:hypothetical protein
MRSLGLFMIRTGQITILEGSKLFDLITQGISNDGLLPDEVEETHLYDPRGFVSCKHLRLAEQGTRRSYYVTRITNFVTCPNCLAILGNHAYLAI